MRDNRGKTLGGIPHDLAFVVVSFLIAILRSTGKLNLSAIHRKMEKNHCRMIEDTNCSVGRCISYTQLRRILKMFDYKQFNEINKTYFECIIEGEATQIGSTWQAIDGKELRGNIDKESGAKRGENIVCMVGHQDLHSELIGCYSGDKESEKVIVKDFFMSKASLSDSYSFDALHTSDELLKEIAKKGGYYLAQLKGNQRILLEDCTLIYQHFRPIWQGNTEQKGHGRVEKRVGKAYIMEETSLDKRWQKAGIQSLLVIERTRFQCKTKKQSKEIAYFVSNYACEYAPMLFEAARKHWGVEVNNYVRDKQLGEDDIKSKESNLIRSIASFINLAINLLRKQNKENNISILREKLAEDKAMIYECFSKNKFYD